MRSHLRLKFGITPEHYKVLYQHQNGRCAICKGKNRGQTLAVDHDHKTGRVRSLLCTSCNVGLGHFRESPKLCRIAALYLEIVSSF